MAVTNVDTSHNNSRFVGLPSGRDYLVSRIRFTNRLSPTQLEWTIDEIFSGQGYGQPTLEIFNLDNVQSAELVATFTAPFMNNLNYYLSASDLPTNYVSPFGVNTSGFANWNGAGEITDLEEITLTWWLNEEESYFDGTQGDLRIYSRNNSWFSDGVSANEIEIRWYPSLAIQIDQSL
tara:strand:- start:66 stop:599 length:534 start_codon:yes stop_codon:yes gene_type:complete